MKFKDSGILRDAAGLNEKAFHFLEVSYLQNELDFENAFEVRGARILSSIPGIDPDVITAHLASGTMIPVAPAKIAQAFTPVVANIIDRMGKLVAMPVAQHRDALAASEEGVRLSYLVKGIDHMEERLRRYDGKALDETVTETVMHKGAPVHVSVTVGEFLKEAYDTAVHITQHIVVQTGARMLNDRFEEALGKLRLRLDISAPGFNLAAKRRPAPGKFMN